MEDLPIVVGYDRSAGARAALSWALDEAAGRRMPLRLVYVVEMPVTADAMFPTPFECSCEAVRVQGQSLLADALAEAAAAHPAVEVRSTMLAGSAAATLCELSDEARLIVVGRGGPGGVAGRPVGSTGMAVAAHAHCPVVVVRDGAADQGLGGPVVVGFDDSPHAQVAAAFAFEEAAMRQTGLVAVRAWTPPTLDVTELEAAELEAAERHSLELAIESLAAKYPSVAVTSRLIAGNARRVLAETSARARLVAVGSRGRGGFAGVFPGSISHHLLHHARCPVAVVPR